MSGEYTNQEHRAADIVQSMILDKLNDLSEDMKKLWEANHEQALQISNLVNPNSCIVKHDELIDIVLKKIEDKEDRSHRNIVDTVKIVGGGGGMATLVHYIFKLMGK